MTPMCSSATYLLRLLIHGYSPPAFDSPSTSKQRRLPIMNYASENANYTGLPTNWVTIPRPRRRKSGYSKIFSTVAGSQLDGWLRESREEEPWNGVDAITSVMENDSEHREPACAERSWSVQVCSGSQDGADSVQ
ncbi:hypothetical protein GQ53DRAFT_881557 [Thozetella sp. PMI_491]|nr:hypothetical protein GQ53DRAFT_881557 [Thozetella sp. PMI_491]